MSNTQSKERTSTVSSSLEKFAKSPEGKIYPTVENFYKFCSNRELKGVKCQECSNIFFPPKLLCPKCNSSNLDWIDLKGKGILLTYSVVHVAPLEFESITPYIVGIVKLEGGISLPGIIKLNKIEEVKIGMELIVDFEESSTKSWIGRTRYYFRQA